MGRKRKNSAAAVVERPIFCFYCDRTFADETTLIIHQKGKHFKCTECSKRLNSVGGCAIHLLQVHRIEIKSVPNSKEGRGGLEWEIFGMAGVPDGMMPGGPVPESEDPALKAQKLGDEAPGQAPHGQYHHGGQYPPPGSGLYSMPFPMMHPPPHGFPPMPPGSFGMMPPPGMAPAPYGFRPPPPSMFPPGHQLPPQHQLGMPPGVTMPPGSGGGEPPGLQPHSSGPLFPLDLLKPVAVAAAETIPPPLSTTPGAVAGGGGEASAEAPLLWTDERFSMEERRAQMLQSRGRPPAARPTSFAAAPSLRQPALQTPLQPPHQLHAAIHLPPQQPPNLSPHQQQQQQARGPQQETSRY